MKLINKLIPIATGLTCVSALAPLSTSCSARVSAELIDLRNGYTPSIERATYKTPVATKVEMLEFYTSAINANPEIFVQDWLWTDALEYARLRDQKVSNQQITIDNFEYVYQAIYNFEKLSANIYNVKLQRATLGESGSQYTSYLLSFDSKLTFAEKGNRIVGDYYSGNEYTQEYGNDVTYVYSLKNMPIAINLNGRNLSQKSEVMGTDWFVCFDIGYNGSFDLTRLQDLTAAGYEWSIDSKINITEYSKNTSIPGSTTKENSSSINTCINNIVDAQRDENYSIMYDLFNLTIGSHYLSKIIAGEKV